MPEDYFDLTEDIVHETKLSQKRDSKEQDQKSLSEGTDDVHNAPRDKSKDDIVDHQAEPTYLTKKNYWYLVKLCKLAKDYDRLGMSKKAKELIDLLQKMPDSISSANWFVPEY